MFSGELLACLEVLPVGRFGGRARVSSGFTIAKLECKHGLVWFVWSGLVVLAWLVWFVWSGFFGPAFLVRQAKT
jgi:hypothetical protein